MTLTRRSFLTAAMAAALAAKAAPLGATELPKITYGPWEFDKDLGDRMHLVSRAIYVEGKDELIAVTRIPYSAVDEDDPNWRDKAKERMTERYNSDLEDLLSGEWDPWAEQEFAA